jgi:hypothetical protein
MSKRPPKGPQLDSIPRIGDLPQVSLDLKKLDQFSTGLGVDFIHWKAVPSPIGLKDRGDYRRPDGLDIMSSNGMIYIKAGCFTATFIGNPDSHNFGEGSILDYSTARLVMPRFYNKNSEVAAGERIYIAPGDRIYIADKNVDVNVPNYHRMDFNAQTLVDKANFPISKVEWIVDSLGRNYTEGKDFFISLDGDIHWLPNGNNPGIDPDTGKGRVYSIRYLYKAHWYCVSIPNEVRITNVTTNGVRVSERMPYHIIIQREYVYRNQNNNGNNDQPKTEIAPRTVQQPTSNIDPNSPKIKVDMTYISDE